MNMKSILREGGWRKERKERGSRSQEGEQKREWTRRKAEKQ